MNTIRWSDQQRQFGVVIYSADTWKKFGMVLDSGHDETPCCSLRFSVGAHTLIFLLPQIIRPWRKWVDTSHYAWSKGHGAGYWDEHSRNYGFQLSDGFLQVFLGPQTHDSTTTKNWCCHLPWQDWRFVRMSYYGLAGEHHWTEMEKGRASGPTGFLSQQAAKDAVPKARFTFADFDGEIIEATTHIEEREWRFGTKWCAWLSWFRPAKISRSLALEFSKEVGRKKGSWKGGVMGHGINMLPGELHEAAFRRYCAEHEMTFLR